MFLLQKLKDFRPLNREIIHFLVGERKKGVTNWLEHSIHENSDGEKFLKSVEKIELSLNSYRREKSFFGKKKSVSEKKSPSVVSHWLTDEPPYQEDKKVRQSSVNWRIFRQWSEVFK